MRTYLFLCFILLPGLAYANIAAVVNDAAITDYDVDARLKLVTFSSGIARTKASLDKLRPQVRQSLIDEQLQMQEAARLDIEISEEELANAYANLEKQNRLKPGTLQAFIKRNGIPWPTMEKQIEASLAWANVVRRQFGGQAAPSDGEIDAVYDRLKESHGKPEYLLAEIYLNGRANDPSVRETIRAIQNGLRQGANFSALARQFSDSATANIGGDLGWLVAAELEPRLLNAVKNLRKGQLSGVVESEEGVSLYLLRDRRIVGGRQGAPSAVRLYQLGFVEKDTTKAQEFLSKVRRQISSCGSAKAFADRNENLSGTNLGRFPLSQLAPPVRKALSGIPKGGVTQPLRQGEAQWALFVVCDKTVPIKVSELPARDDIATRLRIQKLERFARRYLRDLRSQAFIEVRGGDE